MWLRQIASKIGAGERKVIIKKINAEGREEKKSVLRVFIARLNSGSWSLFPENEGKLYSSRNELQTNFIG